jgi:hypothetical protein
MASKKNNCKKTCSYFVFFLDLWSENDEFFRWVVKLRNSECLMIRKNKIILVCLPYFTLDTPMPGLSVLKSYLETFGFDVNINYWNLRMNRLQKDFILSNKNLNVLGSLLFFGNYLAVKKGDTSACRYIKYRLKTLNSDYIRKGDAVFDKHIRFYAEKLDALIDEMIAEIDFSEVLCVGFSMIFHQWLPASIVAEKMKEQYPDVPIVVGGIGAKEKAVSFIDNFTCFDCAIWGEGEIPFLNLCSEFQKTPANRRLESIENLIYRANNSIACSSPVNRRYPDLSSPGMPPIIPIIFTKKKNKSCNSVNYCTFP